MDQNHFSHFSSGSPKKLFSEIIFKSGHLPTRICHLKVFLLITLEAKLGSVEQNNFSNFGRGSPKKHPCGIILKSGLWSTRICHLRVLLFLALVAILFIRAEGF